MIGSQFSDPCLFTEIFIKSWERFLFIAQYAHMHTYYEYWKQIPGCRQAFKIAFPHPHPVEPQLEVTYTYVPDAKY